MADFVFEFGDVAERRADVVGVEHVEPDHRAAVAHPQQGLVVARRRSGRGTREGMRHVAAVGLVPGLILLDGREELHEFLDVVLVLGDARPRRGRVLGVVEGDKHLLVRGFGELDERDRPVQRVPVHDGVVGRDVSHDLGVQAGPADVAEHVRVLITDAGHVGTCGMRARSGRAPGGGGCGQQAAQQGDAGERRGESRN